MVLPNEISYCTCFLSSFRLAISAAFSSFDIPTVLGAVLTGTGDSALFSAGAGEETLDDRGLGVARAGLFILLVVGPFRV
ncbi:hypothetical protein NEOLEDRAFT_453134 [Neolentinus lepideus HHB14362 ss-1]|uniref:Uncharacterized protein n=1 Tax=Neolentinus lepideus HHB14362 ss-1 TaxID=1314782 RepID=A0A165RTZ3_9AGAM|nr:hypothetical protein NEOLEDRAFT_453134 [Neolentinus lepideus HHB14362 ss-1]